MLLSTWLSFLDYIHCSSSLLVSYFPSILMLLFQVIIVSWYLPFFTSKISNYQKEVPNQEDYISQDTNTRAKKHKQSDINGIWFTKDSSERQVTQRDNEKARLIILRIRTVHKEVYNCNLVALKSYLST